MAMPPEPGTEGASNYDGPIPACVHLHGGEVPPVLDGGPDAWFTSDGSYIGHAYYSKDGNTPKITAYIAILTARKAHRSGSTITPWAPHG